MRYIEGDPVGNGIPEVSLQIPPALMEEINFRKMPDLGLVGRAAVVGLLAAGSMAVIGLMNENNNQTDTGLGRPGVQVQVTPGFTDNGLTDPYTQDGVNSPNPTGLDICGIIYEGDGWFTALMRAGDTHIWYYDKVEIRRANGEVFRGSYEEAVKKFEIAYVGDQICAVGK